MRRIPIRSLAASTVCLLIAVGCGSSTNDSGNDDAADSGAADVGEDTLDDFLGESDESPAAADGEVFSGLVTLVVGGTTYEFEAPDCRPEPEANSLVPTADFAATGTGQVDGEPFGGFIQRLVQDLDGDGEDEVLHTIRIEVGREDTGRQAEPELPSLFVQVVEDEDPDGLLQVGYEVGRISGSGRFVDRNAVLGTGQPDLAFTFVGTCV